MTSKNQTKKTSALNKRSNRRKGTTVRQLRVHNLHHFSGVDMGALDVLLVVTRGRRSWGNTQISHDQKRTINTNYII